MFDVAKCHLSLKTDFQLEFSKSIRDLSSLIAKEFSLLMFKIVVRVIYVRENVQKSIQSGHENANYLILDTSQQFT